MASTGHHDERAPERTTPQGTQEAGVEHGHEGTDVDLGAILTWFGGAAVFVLVFIVLLWGTFKWWAARETRNDLLPSPLFAVQQTPPTPRIMPNPVDSGPNPRESAPEYPESLPGERKREDEELQRLGLQDPATGLPRLPDRAVAAVIAASHRPGIGGRPYAASQQPGGRLQQLMPSEASGGTALENWLQ